MLALVAAGFITRRVLAPHLMHFLTHREPSAEHPVLAHGEPPQAPAEVLTNSERRALDQIVRERSK